MTRKEWMNHPDEDMTYTEDGFPALLQYNVLTGQMEICEIEAGEGV